MNANNNLSHSAGAAPLQQPAAQAAQVVDLQVDFAQLLFFEARCRELQREMADNDEQLARINALLNRPAPQPPEDTELLLGLASLYLTENRQYLEMLRTMQTETFAIIGRLEALSRDGEEVNNLRRAQDGLRRFVATAEDGLGVNQSNIEKMRQLQAGDGSNAGPGP
ncbi:hypothetical protein H2200_010913 [Cladophialophora chaetospira]|uniref:Uncharacterized protein n=1 Tax=Cladophialophora chaetospira TaxID=386627 RepID=A0AA38X127_9EURO|nr:hypothetical protein H2200_010913 [Cladophialophora chaetospira]